MLNSILTFVTWPPEGERYCDEYVCSDVSSRTWPRSRGSSRTKSSGLGLGLGLDRKVLGLGLGLDNKVLGLGLGLEIKVVGRM